MRFHTIVKVLHMENLDIYTLTKHLQALQKMCKLKDNIIILSHNLSFRILNLRCNQGIKIQF